MSSRRSLDAMGNERVERLGVRQRPAHESGAPLGHQRADRRFAGNSDSGQRHTDDQESHEQHEPGGGVEHDRDERSRGRGGRDGEHRPEHPDEQIEEPVDIVHHPLEYVAASPAGNAHGRDVGEPVDDTARVSAE